MTDVLNEVLPLGKRRLLPGVQYRVIAEFIDDDKSVHSAGERWGYLGFEQSKMYPGYVIHAVAMDGAKLKFRLKWGADGQPEVVNNFEEYVVGPIVESSVLLDGLSSDAQMSLERIRSWLEPLPKFSDALVERVRSCAQNASIAAEKGDREQPATDLGKIAHELEQGLKGLRA